MGEWLIFLQPRRRHAHTVRALVIVSAFALSGCTSEPELVFVPVAPPEVEVSVRASAVEVSVGEPIVLHAQRRYRAQWKQVKRRSLPLEQCWMALPPPAMESEVADNLTWQVSKPSVARFNTGLRADRTREVVFSEPGAFVLQATSAVWCGAPSGVQANALAVNVRPPGSAPAGGK